MTNLAGKTAVITGGTSGIGRAIALTLARAGARVIVAARNPGTRPGGYDEDAGRTVVELLTGEGRDAAFVATDVSKPEDIESLADFAVARFGAIDIWINNAGAMPVPRSFLDYSIEELDWLLAVNTKSVWLGMRAAARRMVDAGRGGAIVNVLSTAAIRPHPNQSIYDMSKGAAAQATLCAALELGQAGIRVNAVCPTLVKTAVTRGLIESPGFVDWFGSVTTLGRAVDAAQVADAVLLLASDAAATMTGVLLPIDSGESLGAPAAALPIMAD